ncbi:hypothetical protein PAALTS15_19688 [Paenibacillus alvei TS-15]|uniref:Uncharacterized protein n=1 Tax=Paenibacillus alvei TS-15 TaxID=1117108 RepID=S9TSX2_PAEAL|nr:hypothetical protein [Paenibacillus alvei]EPY05421.1 hypothetical protein PAALTS15_19688 [Paenibacillus alvei TS-15]
MKSSGAIMLAVLILLLFAMSMELTTIVEDAKGNSTRVTPTSTSTLTEVGLVNPPVRSKDANHVTDEEFYSRYAAITGQTLDQVRSHLQEANEEQTGYRTFYKEYVLRTESKEGEWVRAGVLAQIEQFRFGQSVVNRFKGIFDETAYLLKETGGSSMVTNYVKGTIQASGNLQLSFSGYTEDVVRSGLFTYGERREARVPLLSELGESDVGHWYDRQHVSGSGTFSPG